ncbi:MAG: winged helix-turn-helix domain-containing protein [Colwellia sp.]|nr:winged helix-turn-helix domain-containing protein [Colwellia sp.]
MENIYFLQWKFSFLDGQLKSKEQTHRLPPIQAKLLAFLLNNAGQLLSREEIIDHVWQDKIVNEDALSRSIAQLRALLADDRKNPVYIETIPKRGYRFIAKIRSAAKEEIETSHSISKNFPYKVSLIVSIVFMLLIGGWFFQKTNESSKWDHIFNQAINNAQRLTADTYIEYQAELSADGQFITLVYRKEGQYITRVLTREGQVKFELANKKSKYLSPILSHDNNQLLSAVIENKKCRIALVTVATLNQETISSCQLPNESSIFDWAKDGKSFLYVDNGSEHSTTAIWLYNLATKTTKQLTFPGNTTNYDTRPRFSPNDKSISFIRGTDSIRNIYQAARNDLANVDQLTSEKSMILSHQWIDDDHIIFDSNKRGDKNIWLLDVAEKTITNLGAKDGQIPSVDRLGETLIYQEKKYQANLWQINLTSKEETLLVSSAKFDNHPAYSPNGEQLAFTSNRNGISDIWLYDIKEKKELKLLSIKGESLISPFWHPSENKLLISTLNDKGYQCLEFDNNTLSFKRINAGKYQISHCIYHANKSIYAITKNVNDVSQLIEILPDNSVSILTTDGATSLKVLTNGHLIYTKPDNNGLYIVNDKGRFIELILPDFPSYLAEHWTISNSHIYYANFQKDQKGTWKINLTTKQKTKVSSSLSTAVGSSMAVSPDQKNLIITKLDKVESDIYIFKSHLD